MRWNLPYRVLNRLERLWVQRRTKTTSQPDLSMRRLRGRLSVVHLCENTTASGVAAVNLATVSRVCLEEDIPYFVVPEPNALRHRVGIVDEHWNRFIEALASSASNRGVYMTVTARDRLGRRQRWSCLVGDRRGRRGARSQNQVDIFELIEVAPDTPPLGLRYACLVERWRPDEEGGLVAPGRNDLTAYLGAAELERVERELSTGAVVPTFRRLAERHVFDVDFPIDVVYTWVDGEDPAWLERKLAAALASSSNMAHLSHDFLFRDHQELRYSLRSLEQFAPWVRNVYLVTDDQTPDWLDPGHPRLRIVHHSELFGTAGALPTFNSHAIEARLHHLDGLAEHYLYLNDDFFFGRPVPPSLFFASNGQHRFHLSRSALAWTDASDTPAHEQARRNVVKLLEEDFGRTATRSFFHTPIAQRRSLLHELEERYPAAFQATWANQFRSPGDYVITSWLHHYYAYFTGRSAPGSIRYDYFNVSDEAAQRRMHQQLRRRNLDAFCINDVGASTEELRAQYVTGWLGQYLPRPSTFEK